MVTLVHQNECFVVWVRTVTIAMKPSWFLWIYANYHSFPKKKNRNPRKTREKNPCVCNANIQCWTSKLSVYMHVYNCSQLWISIKITVDVQIYQPCGLNVHAIKKLFISCTFLFSFPYFLVIGCLWHLQNVSSTHKSCIGSPSVWTPWFTFDRCWCIGSYISCHTYGDTQG